MAEVLCPQPYRACAAIIAQSRPLGVVLKGLRSKRGETGKETCLERIDVDCDADPLISLPGAVELPYALPSALFSPPRLPVLPS